MRENNPPRWSFLSLWNWLKQKLIGFKQLETPNPLILSLYLQIPTSDILNQLLLNPSLQTFDLPIQSLELRYTDLSPEMITLLRENRQQQEILLRPFDRQNYTYQFREQRIFPEQFFRPQRDDEEAYRQWRRQNIFPALPDSDDFRNASKLAAIPGLDIPQEFICVITQEIMTDPVYDPNFLHHRYDRHAIERWLIGHVTNPLTRTPLTTENLVADDVLKGRIDEFVADALQTSVALIPSK